MKYFLENRISAYMLFAALFIFGVIGCDRLAVSLMPQTASPGISVIIEYPGVSPDKIEEILTKPVEKIVKTIEGIVRLSSVSEEGKATINVEFGLDTDARMGALKVREKIGLIRDTFPREVQEPLVIRYDPSDRPVLIATVEKKGLSLVQVRELAERKIKPLLQRIDGVSEINVAGGLVREIHVDVDRAGMESRNLSFNDLNPVVAQGNVSMPAGIMYGKGGNYLVTALCRYTTVGDIANAVVMTGGSGSAILLSTIAVVAEGYRDPDDISRLDGNEKVTLYVHKAGNANALAVCREAAELLGSNRYADARVVYSQGDYIAAAVRNVAFSALWGILIVILVLALFIRKPLMVGAISLSIPFSLVMTFAVMYFLGTDLNVMSLSGLALGAGMVVDNGIVVTEVVYRNATVTTETIRRSVSRVTGAIVASTLTTMIVFIPLYFGDSATRRAYGDLALSVSAALAMSILVSLVFIPALYAEFAAGGARVPLSSVTMPEAVAAYKKRILNSADQWEKRAAVCYQAIISDSFADKRRVFIITGIAMAVALACFLTIKSETVDPMAGGEMNVYLEFPAGTSLAVTDGYVKKAEGIVTSMKIAERITTKVEKWRGTLTVKFADDASSVSRQREIKRVLKEKLNKLLRPHDAFAFISEADAAAARELDIHFIGDDNGALRELAKQAAQKIQGIAGIDECVLRFREGRPEYLLTVDRDKAAVAGVSPAAIADFLRYALYGPVVTKFIDIDREVDVRLRFRGEERKDIDDVLGYRIKNDAGDPVPVAELVTMRESEGSTRIWRRNGRRSVTITAKLGDFTFDDAADRIAAAMTGVSFPADYGYQFDETLMEMRKSRRAMILAVLAAILLDYMLLASLFESLTLPFVIMATIPLAFIGVILALFITGSTLNISVYIGLIILVGIVVNNGIILVSEIDQRLAEGSVAGKDLTGLIREVCLERFRPVLLTTVTTVMGMAPMLISSGEGSSLWRPLALTVTSGLSCSTALTLVVVPLLSSYFFKNRFDTILANEVTRSLPKRKRSSARFKEKNA